MATRPHLAMEEYRVGWICALYTEVAACRAMLDEAFGKITDQVGEDYNSYFTGRVHDHNVVIACLPAGIDGLTAAATVAKDMVRTFTGLRFGLLIGIGGGIPNLKRGVDIRLGDVVVSQPMDTNGGVIQYDKGKSLDGNTFELKGALNAPPMTLLTALNTLRSEHELLGSQIPTYLSTMMERYPVMKETGYEYPGMDQDHLYCSQCHQSHDEACDTRCKEHIRRVPRKDSRPAIHYGVIASANQVVKDASTRDYLGREHNALCVEMEAAGLMNNFPCIVIRGICDYADSHKDDRWHKYAAATAAAYAKELLFHVSVQQTEYEKPIQRILETVKENGEQIRQHINRYQFDKNREERLKILEWLAPSTYYQQYEDILQKRYPGTGQWFLQHEQFREWRNGEPSTLFCSGIPGAGKSIITSLVIESLSSAQNSPEEALMYFLCSYSRQEEQNVKAFFAVFLRQLVEQQVSLPNDVQQLYNLHEQKRTQPSLEEKFTALINTARQFKRLHLIIDALDECEAHTCRKLLAQVQRLKEELKSQGTTSLSLMFTSRPGQSFEHQFKNEMNLKIRANEDDQRAYLNSRFDELSECIKGDSALQRRIQDRIVEAADGMFLLVTLYFESLKGKRTIFDIERTLAQNISTSGNGRSQAALSVAYDGAIRRIEEQSEDDRAWAQLAICWIVHTQRPLDLQQMREVLALRAGQVELNDKHKPSVREIISLCAGLLTVNPNSDSVELVHYTTREYLEHPEYQPSWIRNAMARIATTCITYLRLENLNKRSSTSEFGRNAHHINPLQFPFFSYAARYWGNHVYRVQTETQIQQMTIEFLQNISAVEKTLHAMAYAFDYDGGVWGIFAYDNVLQWTSIHLASYFGLAEILAVIFRRNPTRAGIIDQQDQGNESPCYIASYQGHENVVRVLLDNGANPNAQGGLYGSALQAASYGGHDKVVKILLKAGADVNAEGGLYGHALHAASDCGYEKVVQILLLYGAPVNQQSKGCTPLSLAVERGHKAVIKLLTESGAEFYSSEKIPG